MHGRIYIILKESLKRIPILGWGMQFSQFIFLKRNWEKDKPNLSKHLQTLNKPDVPMWLLVFPEGTNLAPGTRRASARWAEKNGIRDMQHQLLPRSTGLRFCLQELRETTDWLYDCTIAYEGVPRGKYAQDIFTIRAAYLEGHPPKCVNMYWRRFAISSIPLDDPDAFEVWLRNRWREKDALIEGFYRTGSFPADNGVTKIPNGTTRRGTGYIEAQIKSSKWYEFMQIFAPISLFGLVLYMFYGSLPKKFIKGIQNTNKKALKDKIPTLRNAQIQLPQKQMEAVKQLQALRSGRVKGNAAKILTDSVRKQVLSAPMTKDVNDQIVGLKKAAETTSTPQIKAAARAIPDLSSIQKPVQKPSAAPAKKQVPKQPAKPNGVLKAPAKFTPLKQSQPSKASQPTTKKTAKPASSPAVQKPTQPLKKLGPASTATSSKWSDTQSVASSAPKKLAPRQADAKVARKANQPQANGTASKAQPAKKAATSATSAKPTITAAKMATSKAPASKAATSGAANTSKPKATQKSTAVPKKLDTNTKAAAPKKLATSSGVKK